MNCVVVLKYVVCEIREKNLIMEHPVGGAIDYSEEHLLEKVSELEKRLENCWGLIKQLNDAVSFYRQETMTAEAVNVKKDKEIQDKDKEILHLEHKIDYFRERLQIGRAVSEDIGTRKAACKPMGKGQKSTLRDGGGADEDEGHEEQKT